MVSFVPHNVHHSSPVIHLFMCLFLSICILMSLLLVSFLRPLSSYLFYVLPNILAAFSTPTSHFLLPFSHRVFSYSADDWCLAPFYMQINYL